VSNDIPWHDRFRLKPKNEQADLIKEIGTYLMSRQRLGCEVRLYWMGEFFGELFVNPDGTLNRVRTFTTYETLGWYPDFISIENLKLDELGH